MIVEAQEHRELTHTAVGDIKTHIDVVDEVRVLESDTPHNGPRSTATVGITHVDGRNDNIGLVCENGVVTLPWSTCCFRGLLPFTPGVDAGDHVEVFGIVYEPGMSVRGTDVLDLIGR